MTNARRLLSTRLDLDMRAHPPSQAPRAEAASRNQRTCVPGGSQGMQGVCSQIELLSGFESRVPPACREPFLRWLVPGTCSSRINANGPTVREMTIFMRQWPLVRASCVLPTRISALQTPSKTLFLAGFAAFIIITAGAARAAEPTASGLWQKQDEAGHSVGWF